MGSDEAMTFSQWRALPKHDRPDARFICLICQQERRLTRWMSQRDLPLHLVCMTCEGRGRKAAGGTFMDRRLAQVGSAIAEALSHQATARNYYGRP